MIPRVRAGTLLRSARILATLAALALVALAPAHAEAERSPSTKRARAVYERLLAPCCWKQTLSDHDSPLASQLRSEIAARLWAGELPAAIEDDLAGRYGERVRALPRGRDPLERVGLAVICVLFAVSFYLAHRGWRWSRRGSASPSHAAHSRPSASEDPQGRYEQALERIDSRG